MGGLQAFEWVVRDRCRSRLRNFNAEDAEISRRARRTSRRSTLTSDMPEVFGQLRGPSDAPHWMSKHSPTHDGSTSTAKELVAAPDPLTSANLRVLCVKNAGLCAETICREPAAPQLPTLLPEDSYFLISCEEAATHWAAASYASTQNLSPISYFLTAD